ncbi:MAG: tetratricopeptide repeat protein [Clostridiaceae bacterium]|nr:tetratricopeptide repeat protein [Clostridiaceae bacterium]
MDKYEFNIKVEQIKKLVNKSDYETAMKIADTIDWRRVRNTNLLSLVAQVYEKNEEYQDAKDILLLAFERAPIGKRLLYKLTELALKEKNVSEAEDYYREFCDLAPDDPRQNLLRYMILKEKGAPAEQLIHSLERYTNTELEEKWIYELAELYQEAGKIDECIRTCDKIMLMFGLGKYVDKAMDLKMQYAPLNGYQMDLVENRDKYEEKLKAVEQQYSAPRLLDDEEDYEEDEDNEDEIPSPMHLHRNVDEELTANLHEAEVEERLAEEMSRISVEDDGETEPDESSSVTKVLKAIRDIAPEKGSDLPEQLPETVEFSEEEMPEHIAEPDEDYEEEAYAEPYQEPEEEYAKAVQEDPEEEEEPLEEIMVDREEEPEFLPVNHLMIEARTPEKGLEMAVEALKQIHEENGIKHQVLKISGSKLSKRGIFASEDKISGKDLVIEEAGDLTPEALAELNQFMDRDETGTIVVLIDNPRQMEELHGQNPQLAAKFECIGVKDEDPIEDVSEAVLKQIALQEDIAREEIQGEAGEEVEEEIPVPVKKAAMPEEKRAKKVAQPRPEVRQEKAVQPRREDIKQPDADEEMDLDEFAQYACKYAGEIDCSISGKSMLALYERIEIMEEDGIPLTRANAEELIEEAADKAEKPSIGKLIKGVFSPKYDKDGMLILKEQHFID